MKYFGTDGVRGVANKTLSPELAFKLGRAGGYVLTKHAENKSMRPKVIVARDTRISGEMLGNALVAGLLSVGIEVLKLGIMTTPGVAYLVRTEGANAGIMISASHNPVQDNGIKFFGGDGYKLSDEQEEEIEVLLDKKTDSLPRPAAEGLGTAKNFNEGVQRYIQFLEKTIPNDLTGLHIAVDGANGSTSELIKSLFLELGVELETTAVSSNGLNINNGVVSTHPDNLAKFVTKTGAQGGVAFDGDGDRCIAVDELGNIIDGDKIMYICGKYMSDTGRLKKETIVTTVMSNLGLYKAMGANGLSSVKTQVGDRYVAQEMRKNGYNLGGEQSGHIIFSDYNTTGDGMLTAIQLLNVLKQTGKKLSELAAEVTTYPQELVNVHVVDKKAALNNQLIKSKITEVEEKMAGEGRVLVRPSGTENLLRVMAEAATPELVHNYVMEIVDVVKSEVGVG
ncbi:phosphoglucosamine mutase [Liquorilactobacillus capillatus]|uniref:Phosphoglucosamine mutase n=1 Tax=Liquorilactobacillus capillatus DSM 19910 TaxID=1423731 RepID=A0A0R1M3I3_9LACO|nr:phosphoglucosamine mutase [Liquorilactobacillus capillatus]KRL02592.1 phosphoglucosamine mutase [Liquorilactobacillus capillatus DSM 19910]